MVILLLIQDNLNVIYVNEVCYQTTVVNIALFYGYVEIVKRLLKHPEIKINRQ